MFSWKFSYVFDTAFLQNSSKQRLFKVICNAPCNFSASKYTDILIHWQRKAKGVIMTNAWIFIQTKFDFWQETSTFLLFKLLKQFKIYSPFKKDKFRLNLKNHHSRKLIAAEICQLQGTTHVFASFPWLAMTCLNFECLNNVDFDHEFKFYRTVKVILNVIYIFTNIKHELHTQCCVHTC